MWQRRNFMMAASAAGLTLAVSACARKLPVYRGPEVTRVVVQKAQRKIYLLNGPDVIKSYDMGLGFAPVGPKRFENDGKTPEGSYFITHRNAKSAFHLSLGVSYPNDQDRAFAASFGKKPGGDIFVHGQAGKNRGRGRDWTAGCIAVTDQEIEEIYVMVNPGTQIDINA